MIDNQQRRDFLGVAAAATVLALLPACSDSAVPGLAVGEQFPAATLQDLDGRSVALANYAGTALVVNFWATWCAPCRREMPSLQRLSEQFRAQDLQVLGITVDDDLNLVREFQLRHQIGFRLLSDRGQKLSRDVLQVPVFPMTYLVTRAGLVARLVPGEQDWMASSMLSEIEQLLAVRRQQPAAVEPLR